MQAKFINEQVFKPKTKEEIFDNIINTILDNYKKHSVSYDLTSYQRYSRYINFHVGDQFFGSKLEKHGQYFFATSNAPIKFYTKNTNVDFGIIGENTVYFKPPFNEKELVTQLIKNVNDTEYWIHMRNFINDMNEAFKLKAKPGALEELNKWKFENLLQPTDYPDWEKEWLNSNKNLAEKLNYKESDTDNGQIVSFDIDMTIDRFPGEYETIEKMAKPHVFDVKYKILPDFSGGLTLEMHEFPNGTKAIYYYGGMADGYIARKEWIK